MKRWHLLLLFPLFGFLGFESGATVGGWDVTGLFHPIAVDQYGNQGRQFMGGTVAIAVTSSDTISFLDAGGNYRVLCSSNVWMSGATLNVDGGPIFTDGGCDAGLEAQYDGGCFAGQDGGPVEGSDAGYLYGTDGGPLLGTDGGFFIWQDGGPIGYNAGSDGGPYTQDGGPANGFDAGPFWQDGGPTGALGQDGGPYCSFGDGGPWLGPCFNLDGGNIQVDAGLTVGAGTPILAGIPEAWSFGYSTNPTVHIISADAGTCWFTSLSINTQ